jgi:hypothetical protein
MLVVAPARSGRDEGPWCSCVATSEGSLRTRDGRASSLRPVSNQAQLRVTNNLKAAQDEDGEVVLERWLTSQDPEIGGYVSLPPLGLIKAVHLLRTT